MYLVITTDTEIITGGVAGTIGFQLVSDAAAAIATNGTATVHLDSGTFVTGATTTGDANIQAGGVVFMGAMPTGAARTYERYLGVLSTVATATVTAGNLNAFLTYDPSAWAAYADGANAP